MLELVVLVVVSLVHPHDTFDKNDDFDGEVLICAPAVFFVVVVVPGNASFSTISSPAAPDANSNNNPIWAKDLPNGDDDNNGDGAFALLCERECELCEWDGVDFLRRE